MTFKKLVKFIFWPARRPGAAVKEGVFLSRATEIVLFRAAQYGATYYSLKNGQGGSKDDIEKYFRP